MFTVGGAMLGCSATRLLLLVCDFGDCAFFFALQHSYGYLQSTLRRSNVFFVVLSGNKGYDRIIMLQKKSKYMSEQGDLHEEKRY